MQSHQVELLTSPPRKALYGLGLSGLCFAVLQLTGQVSAWLAILLLSLYALTIVNQLDQRLRWWLTKSDTPIPLTAEGIQLINEQAGLELDLIHDDDFIPRILTCEPALLDRHDLRESARAILESPQQPRGDATLSVTLSPLSAKQVLPLEDYLELRVLPMLPYLLGRPQVGLFARKTISVGSAFIWRSDYGLVSNIKHLPSSEKINRRPLGDLSVNGLSASLVQSGGHFLRSNALTLANFSWCHTESVSAAQSPYRLLPPNDLGRPNCHFISVQHEALGGESTKQSDQNERRQPVLHSALSVYRELRVGDQLLIFSGEGQNLISVSSRRLLSQLLDLITPALIIAPWLTLLVRLLTR